MNARPDHRAALRDALPDPVTVARALGLLEGAHKKQAGGVVVLCPWHSERHPSCSLTKGPDGTLRAHCFSCEEGGDVFALIAQVHGLDVGRDFVAVLRVAAELAGAGDVLSDLDARSGGRPSPALPPRPRPAVELVAEVPRYPDAEARALWETCTPISADAEVLRYVLETRGIRNARKLAGHVCRALSLDAPRPSWTRHKPDDNAPAATWAETGHRLLVPLVDAHGAMRSVIARAVRPSPRKSAAPSGFNRRGLIMANGLARAVLEHGTLPEGAESLRIVVAEGEPDFLSWVAQGSGEAVLGVFGDSWTPELAARIPDGAELVVRTHDDANDAGTRYAQKILDSLLERLAVRRISVRLAPWFTTRIQDGRTIVTRRAAT